MFLICNRFSSIFDIAYWNFNHQNITLHNLKCMHAYIHNSCFNKPIQHNCIRGTQYINRGWNTTKLNKYKSCKRLWIFLFYIDIEEGLTITISIPCTNFPSAKAAKAKITDKKLLFTNICIHTHKHDSRMDPRNHISNRNSVCIYWTFLKLIRNSRNIATNKYLTKNGRVRRLPIEAMSANYDLLWQHQSSLFDCVSEESTCLGPSMERFCGVCIGWIRYQTIWFTGNKKKMRDSIPLKLLHLFWFFKFLL